MIEFKKIFGIWLVLASGFASGAAQGRIGIVPSGAGAPAAPVTAVAPVVPVVPVVLAGLARVYDDRAWRMARITANKAWREANKEHKRATKKAWREANP